MDTPAGATSIDISRDEAGDAISLPRDKQRKQLEDWMYTPKTPDSLLYALDYPLPEALPAHQRSDTESETGQNH